MKKKTLAIVLCISMLFAITGCGTKEAEENGADKNTEAADAETPAGTETPAAEQPALEKDGLDGKWDTKEYTMATSTPGGTSEIIGAAMTQIWNENIEGTTFSAVPSGGTAVNVQLMFTDQANAGMITADSAQAALDGVEPFTEKYPELRSLFATYPNTLQIWVQKDSGIADFGDLVDKKFTFGQPGSGAYQPGLNLMDLYGFTEEDVNKAGGEIQSLAWSDAVSALQDGNIDAVIWTTSYPAGKIVDAELSREFTLLQLDTKKLEEYKQTYHGWIDVTVPAGTYKGQDKDVTTIGTPNMVAVRADEDPDLVYEMCKALWENLDTLTNTNALLSSITLDTVAQGMSAPLHPGAEKFYNEIGAAMD